MEGAPKKGVGATQQSPAMFAVLDPVALPYYPRPRTFDAIQLHKFTLHPDTSHTQALQDQPDNCHPSQPTRCPHPAQPMSLLSTVCLIAVYMSPQVAATSHSMLQLHSRLQDQSPTVTVGTTLKCTAVRIQY